MGVARSPGVLRIPLFVLVLGATIGVIALGIPHELWTRAWPVWLLMSLAPVLVSIAGLWFRGRHAHGDVPVAEECAGAWAQQVSERLCLKGGVNTSSTNHYDFETALVSLDEATYAETTVRAYASAAHELGHAWIHERGSPRMSSLEIQARSLSSKLRAASLTLALATLVVPSTALRSLVTGLAILAAVLYMLRLVGEARASQKALGLLTEVLTPSARDQAASHLMAAFATYAANALSLTAVACALPWALSLLGAPISIPGTLGTWGEAAVMAALVGGVVLVGATIASMFGAKKAHKMLPVRTAHHVVTTVAPLAIFAVAPAALATGHTVLLVIALIAGLGPVLLPGVLLASVLGAFVSKLDRTPSSPSPWTAVPQNLRKGYGLRVDREGGPWWKPLTNTSYWYLPLLFVVALGI